jgi:GTP cyclohydrolase I
MGKTRKTKDFRPTRGMPANANLPDLDDEDRMAIERDTRTAVGHLLAALRISPDHNTRETPERVARMFVHELFAGRYQPRPKLTDFPNAKLLDEIYVVGPVSIRSMCAHHFCPIEGSAWIGVIPSSRVIGLSKFARLAHWVFARPQIQEEATVQLADEIEAAIKPRALGVIVTARHGCMTLRGVRDRESRMSTSVMRGYFRDKPEARAEFLSLVNMRGFACEPR